MRNTFTIEADIKKSNNRKNIVVTQNDSIRFIIGVFDNGIPFSLSEVSTTSLASTLPDKQTIVSNGLKVGDNTIQFDLGTNETSVPGVVRAVIQLYDSNDRVSTISFTYTVVKDPTGDGYVPSETEQTLIQVVLNDGPLVIQDAQDQANYAKSQGDYAKQVGDENKTTWKTPVADYASIATTYPSPQHGDTVQTLDNGKIYRYNSNTTTWEFTQEYNDTAITDLQNKLSQQDKQSVTLTHGLQVVNAEQNSPLDVSIEGRTLVNLLGTDGNFEDLTSFNGGGTRDTSTYVTGSKSLKIGYEWTNSVKLTDYGVTEGDMLLIIGQAKTDSSTGKPRITTNGKNFYGKSSNDWHVIYGKFIYDSNEADILYLLHGSNQPNYSWFDSFALYKLTSEEYNNIGTTWDDAEVARRYPYVDSVQHVQNPYVIAEGENLLSPFTEWTLHANAKVKSPYELELNATAGNQNSTLDIQVLPNTLYTLTLSTDGLVDIDFRKSDGTYISTPATNISSSTTITTSANTGLMRFYFKSNTSGTFTFTNPMLTLGNQAKPFVPRNPSTLYAELKLGALSDIKDILYRQDGEWLLRKNVEKDEELSASNNTATLSKSAQNNSVIIHDESNGNIYKRVDVLSGSGYEFTQVSKTITFNSGYVPTQPIATYLLATPEIINVTDKVEGDLVVNGSTLVEAGSGFTYTETDGQRDYTLLDGNDRYDVTTNLLSAPSTYNSSLKSVVDDVVAKQADISSTVSVHVRAIAELYKRVKALGG